MPRLRSFYFIALFQAMTAAAKAGSLPPPGTMQSAWAVLSNGSLAYGRDRQTSGRLIDFSHAGYAGGGAKLPTQAPMRHLSPSGRDDTSRIQSALDAIGQLTPNATGMRGILMLAPGTYRLSNSLYLGESGVILRGSGSGQKGTHIIFSNAPQAGIVLQTSAKRSLGAPVWVTDSYIKVGNHTVHVDDAQDLRPGMSVLLNWQVTESKLRALGMSRAAQLGPWAPFALQVERTVLAVQGKRVTLDAPVPDAIDARYLTANMLQMVPLLWPMRLRQVGVENLSASIQSADGQNEAPSIFITVHQAEDIWLHDLAARGFGQGAVHMGPLVRRATVEDISHEHTAAVDSNADKVTDFVFGGTQILMQRISSTGDGIIFVGSLPATAGPNVLRQFDGQGHNSRIALGGRWTTGLLLENIYVPNNVIALGNSPIYGTQLGWDAAFCTVYNSTAQAFALQQPPLATNWCIGCIGDQVVLDHAALFDAPGQTVWPESLYSEQLALRLGEQAQWATGP